MAIGIFWYPLVLDIDYSTLAPNHSDNATVVRGEIPGFFYDEKKVGINSCKADTVAYYTMKVEHNNLGTPSGGLLTENYPKPDLSAP